MLSVILVAAKIGGEIAERFLKIPAIIGELGVGILIGPSALGGIRFFDSIGPVFHEVGPFIAESASHASDVVEPAIPFTLYFVGQLGAVLLLFEAGLETDRKQFLRFIRPATVVALGGVISRLVSARWLRCGSDTPTSTQSKRQSLRCSSARS